MATYSFNMGSPASSNRSLRSRDYYFTRTAVTRVLKNENRARGGKTVVTGEQSPSAYEWLGVC